MAIQCSSPSDCEAPQICCGTFGSQTYDEVDCKDPTDCPGTGTESGDTRIICDTSQNDGQGNNQQCPSTGQHCAKSSDLPAGMGYCSCPANSSEVCSNGTCHYNGCY